MAGLENFADFDDLIYAPISRYDLTDFAWRVIEPLLLDKPRGAPRVDHCWPISGIVDVLQAGCRWKDSSSV